MNEENKITNTIEENIENSLEDNSLQEEIKEEVVEAYDDIKEEINEIFEEFSEDEEIEEKPKKVRKKKKKRKALKAFILAFFIVAISDGLAYSIIKIGSDITGINKPDETIYVEIPQGASTEEIASILKEKEIIEFDWAFRLISKITHADGNYQFGSFELNPSHTFEGIIQELTSETNAVNIVDVTIPEGKTLRQIAAILEANGVCGADEFIKASENAFTTKYSFMPKLHESDKIYYQSEGFLFPDTYTFYLDETPENVLAKLYSNFDKKITDEMYARMNELGISLNQLISLASLIQGESATDEQMTTISSVFWNRINNVNTYTFLQSDVSSRYIENDLKIAIDKSRHADYQDVFDAYDTYKCVGFPSGPVCNPGLKAIQAALYPDGTNYMYFCHNTQTGEVFYAVTLNEHNVNLYKAGLR